MSHNNFGLRLSDNLKAGPISESEDETSGEAIGQGFTVYCNTSDYFQEILISVVIMHKYLYASKSGDKTTNPTARIPNEVILYIGITQCNQVTSAAATC